MLSEPVVPPWPVPAPDPLAGERGEGVGDEAADHEPKLSQASQVDEPRSTSSDATPGRSNLLTSTLGRHLA
eukprot:3356519-Pyramimonas_sp.AAC.1